MSLPTRIHSTRSTHVAPALSTSLSLIEVTEPTTLANRWADSDDFELLDATSIEVLQPLEADDAEEFETITDLDSGDYAHLTLAEPEAESDSEALRVHDPQGGSPIYLDASESDSEDSDDDTVADSEASTETTSVGPNKTGRRKVIQPKRTTERDMEILRGIHWMERATTTHVAYLVEAPSISVGRRLLQLRDRGLVLRQATDDKIQWGLTVKGLRLIGETGNAKANPKRSTIAHRNKKNSIIISLLVGGERMEELAYREALNELATVRAKNSRMALENSLLSAKQEEVRAIPERSRTEEEMRLLRRKPARLIPEVEPVRSVVASHPFQSTPQVAFSESVIVKDFQIWGWEQAQMDWDSEMDQWMNDQAFPVRRPGDETSVNEAEREAMTETVTGRAWMFNHWNLEGKFDKKHQPDGVLVLPHRVQPDGSVLPGSYWIEMEDSRKKLSEIVRVCKQAMDHPLTRGAIYYTNQRAIANLVKKAKKQLALELALRYRTHEGMSLEASEARAQQEVDDAILLKKSPLLNADASGSGFWG